MKRKYQRIEGYWVYVHRIPDNMYYVGQSKKQCCDRWQPYNYKTTVLYSYIDQYGWENIEHLVVKDGLTKEQAMYWEERLIQMYSQMGCLINNNHSGNCTVDAKEYKRQFMREYRQQPEVKEHNRQYQQQYRQQPERKEYQRQYNRQRNQRPEYKEYHRQYNRQRLSTPEWKIYNRVKSYNTNHPDKIIETPLEAKQKYLASGYIPDYIKKSDLI